MYKKIRRYKIVLTVLSFLCICYFILSMYNFLAWEIKIDNTTEYTATLNKIYIADDVCYLSTNELSGNFIFYGDVIEKISDDRLNSMTLGTNIVFRVRNTPEKSKKRKSASFIVSLKTDSEEIFSLQDYNNSRKVYMDHFAYMGLIVSFVLGIILIIVYKKYKASLKKIVCCQA